MEVALQGPEVYEIFLSDVKSMLFGSEFHFCLNV